MALSLDAQALVDAMNTQIRALLIERDRMSNLFDKTLPANTNVWTYLPEDVQTSLRTQISANLTSVRDNINTVIADFNALNGVTQ